MTASRWNAGWRVTEIDIDAMSDFAASIFLILERDGVGAESAISGEVLNEKVNVGCSPISNRDMREVIAKELPFVCFNHRGYFLPANQEEAIATADRIEHYIRGLAMRRKAILAKWPDARQLTLGI